MHEAIDSIAANIAEWTAVNAEHTDANAERAWRHPGILWGVFAIPEAEIRALPESVEGLDVVELGCGTAYFGSWLARRGAKVVGVDPTPAQLATARRMVEKTGIELELVEAPGEAVPLPDAAYDLALSEYGASLWADPEKWVPEAARLLRPGGLLVFLTNSTLVYLTAPEDSDELVGTELLRPLFGMYRIQWDGATGIEYHLSHGDWVALLRKHGFEIEALHELRPGPSAENPSYYDFVDVEWATRWPAEEIWVARKT
ncbi:MAG: class I SAM-dependent methyltransferase [Actinomycetota bacterium]